MATGFLLLNTAGTVQVDENYKNLALSASGSSTTIAGGAYTISDITVTGVNPIIAIRSAAYAVVVQALVSGSSFTFRILIDGPGGTAFDYWVFDEPAASSETFGIRVWNASGELTFDSGRKYMRVSDYIDLNVSGGGSTSYTSGRTYATVFASPGFSYRDELETIPPELGGGTYMASVLSVAVSRWSTHTMTRSNNDIGSAAMASPSAPYDAGKLLVVDVTGY